MKSKVPNRPVRFFLCAGFLLLVTLFSVGQETNTVVPTLVNFDGRLLDANNTPLTGVVGVTFLLYREEHGGSPLWLETQNVRPDRSGHYAVQLGVTKAYGLPTDLFASGEARWLAVQVQERAEQPRVLLMSVPYALKASDAQTLGGLPVSAFVLAAPASSSSLINDAQSGAASDDAMTPATNVTGTGTVNFLPLWTSASNIGNSALFQNGSGGNAKVGINTTSPSAALDVKGATALEGLVTLPATGAATATAGKPSQAESLVASSFNSGTAAAVNQTFQWKAEATANNTTNPSGSLNLLFGSSTNAPAETGLKFSSKGLLTFATGQTFPGTGTITGVTTASGSGLTGGGTSGTLALSLLKTCANKQTLQWNGTAWACATGTGSGTITGVTAGTDLTGGGTTGTVTLNLDTTKVPRLASANTFAANQTVNGTLSATSFSGNGAAITNVNASQLGGQSSVAFAKLASANTFTSPQIINSSGGFSALTVNATGNTDGIISSTTWIAGFGLVGTATATSGSAGGVYGATSSPSGYGVTGIATNTGSGVLGTAVANEGNGVAGLGGLHSAYPTTGVGVWGDSSENAGVAGTSDTSVGVSGNSTSNIGVVGESIDNYGVFGSTASPDHAGVYGFSGDSLLTAVGVQGLSFIRSLTGIGFGSAGVWGDSGTQGHFGVLGTADDGNALFGKNNSGGNETLYVENDSSNTSLGVARVARFAGPGSATYCYIARSTLDVSEGDIVCTGSKSAAVPVNGNRMVRLYAVEAADNWFEDAGSGRLTNGSTVVSFDSTFAQTINSGIEYHVFLTPKGNCNGLYVTNEGSDGFEVHELQNGTSSVAFDFRIMAKRKGYEGTRMADVSADFAQMRTESDRAAAMQEAGKARLKANSALPLPTMRRPIREAKKSQR